MSQFLIRAHQELNKLAELDSSKQPPDKALLFPSGTKVMAKRRYHWVPAVVLKAMCSSTRQQYYVQYVDRKEHDSFTKTMGDVLRSEEWLNMIDVRRIIVFDDFTNRN